MNALFVYGTLMRGEARADLLVGAKGHRPAITHGRLYHLPYGYPAIVDVEDGEVHGELVTFDDLDALLPALDAYEGDLYRRVAREVRVDDSIAQAWCYVLDSDLEAVLVAQGAQRVPSGRWRGRDFQGA